MNVHQNIIKVIEEGIMKFFGYVKRIGNDMIPKIILPRTRVERRSLGNSGWME